MYTQKKYKTHAITAIGLYGVVMLSGIMSSATASDRGELLYENHCQSCHSKTVHTRSDRLVDSPEALRAWVMSWAAHNSLPWGQEEIADITAYLDRALYHFTE